GEYNQAIVNPALINQFDDNDEFSFALNAGAFASDKDGMIDDVDTIGDDLDDLENCNSGCQAQADALKASFDRIDQKIAQVGAGAALMVGVPNRTLPASLIARSYVDAGLLFDYKTTDDDVLDDIANNTPNVDQDDLTSEVHANAIA